MTRFQLARQQSPICERRPPRSRVRRGRRQAKVSFPSALFLTPSSAPARFLDPPASVRFSRLSADVLALRQPEWIGNQLTVTGPVTELVRFRHEAAGPGVVPWSLDLDQFEETWVARLLAPPTDQRGITLQGARILARQLRDTIWETHEWAVGQMASRACPFDLNRLVPVPATILCLGVDHPEAQTWMWRNWGTTWGLRRVEKVSTGMADGLEYRFWSADWAPWPALVTIRERWPILTFELGSLC